MNFELLKKYLEVYNERFSMKGVVQEELSWAIDRSKEVQAWFKNMSEKTEIDFYDFFSPSWALIMWGNKRYQIDKMIH